MNSISDRLFLAYTKKGLSYEELGKRSNVSRATIQRYVTGETDRIDIDKLQAICSVLDVDVANVLGWSDEKEDIDKKLSREIVSLISTFDDSRKRQAIDYLRFLASQSDK